MGCLQSKTAHLPSPDDPSVPNKPESGLFLVFFLFLFYSRFDGS